ncbi:MAG: NB-ARC domain-containing protein [Rivularia sp. (in: cyanobacteria)]
MAKQSKKRSRGVILTLKGWDKLQAAKNQAEFKENGGNRFSLDELRDRTYLALHTISKILGRSKPVDKSSLQYMFATFGLELCKDDYTKPNFPIEDLENQRTSRLSDWGEAPSASIFYGRSEEMLQLRNWVLEEQCRLVTLLGVGGVGKSTLAVKLGAQIQGEFEVVVWRSLRNAPTVEESLTNMLQFLLPALQKEVLIPQSTHFKISKLMECLINHRCLLILDNVETILSSNGQVGECQPGYEGYSQLLKRLGGVPHNSCILLTSREKPREIVPLEGEKTKVKCLKVKGLNLTEARQLFEQKGQFTATEAELQKLIEHYGGNPLALKMVAAGTKEVFNGRIASVLESLQQGIHIFEDIEDLLEQQFQRLSVVEKEVIHRLAINREPVSLADLATEMFTSSCKRHLLQAIKSLLQRSLIEKKGEDFFLQPMVMEYAKQSCSNYHVCSGCMSRLLKIFIA